MDGAPDRLDRVLQVPETGSQVSPDLLRSVRLSGTVLGISALGIGGFAVWAFQTQLPRGGHPDAGAGFAMGLLIIVAIVGVAFLNAVAAGVAWWAKPAALPFPGILCLLDAAVSGYAAVKIHAPLWQIVFVGLAVLQSSAGTLLMWATWARNRERQGQTLAAGVGLLTLFVFLASSAAYRRSEAVSLRLEAAASLPNVRTSAESLVRQVLKFRDQNSRYPKSHKELVRSQQISEEVLFSEYHAPGPDGCAFAVKGMPGGAEYTADIPPKATGSGRSTTTATFTGPRPRR